MITKFQAIKSLRPNVSFEIDGDTIKFLDANIVVPTNDEINTEIARLQALESVNAYKNKRVAEYPSIVEQLDTLYHGGYDAWKSSIKFIKDKYPKGV